MIFLASLLIPLGFLIFMGSLGLQRPTASLVRAWGLAVAASGVVALALSVQPAESGRPGKVLVPALLAFAALVWAGVRTIHWARTRAASRHR